jgi:hypothetical protein
MLCQVAMSVRIYLRSAMNRLDLCLVSIGLFDAIVSLIGLKVRSSPTASTEQNARNTSKVPFSPSVPRYRWA